ncbi:MAG: alpha/beta hydrolase [Oscillospiraceae bacterium]|nr:alpha/beta hydrolase [Oscillospiraceae bacterium]
MVFREFGSKNLPTAILLHGGGLAPWSLESAAKMLSADHHCVLPVLDGHSGADRRFTSVRDNAAEIAEFIESEIGEVELLHGVSLGGQIALELLSLRPKLFRFAVVESALCIPSRMTAAMIAPSVKMSYGLTKYRWFARLQADYLGIPKEYFEDYYRDTCAIDERDMAAFLYANALYELKPELINTEARVLAVCGGKEYGFMKSSALKISERVPNGESLIVPRLRHGELSLARADEFCLLVRNFCAREA